MAVPLNNIKIALRNLWKHKTFSAINLLGLALSMSVCLFILLLIQDAFSYDRFHPRKENIYRVVTSAHRINGNSEDYATSPYPFGYVAQEQLSQVELWTPLIARFSGTMQTPNKHLDFGGLFNTPSFFNMFGFKLEGDPKEALSAPYNLVLTDKMALKLFGDRNVIGRIISIPGYSQDFRITGVLYPSPGKSHLDFDALASVATMETENKSKGDVSGVDNWKDYYSTYNYIRLEDGADFQKVQGEMNDVARPHYAGLSLESRDANYSFSLQPLSEITPGRVLSNQMGKGMPLFLVWFLSGLGLIIVLAAIFNYTNLTIAQALVRVKEVGVRKVMGASMRQVFWQFIGESVIMSWLALILGYSLMQLVKGAFNQLSITELLDMDLHENGQVYLLFILFSTLVGILAGLLPALTLSKTKPIAILQRAVSYPLMKRMGLRRILLVTQLSFTLLFMILVTISWKQVQYALRVNFGFDRPQTLLVDLQDQPYGKAALALNQVPGVGAYTGISIPMGTWMDASEDVRTASDKEKRGVRDYFIDDAYLDYFHLPLIAGKAFQDNPAQQKEAFAIVNESFVRQFELGDPHEAIGKPLILGDSTMVSILGVVGDFPFKPANYKMEPLLLRYDPGRIGYLMLDINSKDVPATLLALGSAWKKLDDQNQFSGEFYDQTIRSNFNNLMDLTRIVALFAILGLIITSMGLMGMAIYNVETKAKEVSIRKLLGATSGEIIVFLSKGYVYLIGVALIIAIPVGIILGAQLLQLFVDRIPWGINVFLPGVLIVTVITLGTIGTQTWKAAFRNPVDSLRNNS